MKHYNILILLIFSAFFSQGQSPCLPENKGALEQIDLYIKGLQDDPAKFDIFIDRVVQHPEYASVVTPIIERVSQEANARINTTEDVKTLLTENDWLQIREIVCSLMVYDMSAGGASAGSGAPPSGGQTPTSPNTQAPAVPLAKIWSSQENKEYSNGDVMEVRYKSTDKHLAFSLKNYPANTETFQWSLIENDIDIAAVVKNNEPNLDNFGLNIGKREGILKLKAKYGNSEVAIDIKIIKEDFTITKLTAFPDGATKRVATAGQTLYLVDGDLNIADASRKIIYRAQLDPNLDALQYASSDVVWKYNDQTKYRYEQLELEKTEIARTLKEDDETLSTSVTGGYPTKATKTIHVKWIDGAIKNFSWVPPAVSAALTRSFQEVEGKMTAVKRYVDLGGMRFNVEPIKITGRLYNQEDPDSRLYREVKYGNISGGLKWETDEKLFTHPVLKKLADWEIAQVGIYAKLEVGVWLQGGMELQKYAENGKESGTVPFIEITPRGCIEAGVKVKLLVAEDLIDFDVKGYAQGCVAGVVRYNFSTNALTGRTFIPPVVVGIKAKIKSKSLLEFELVDYTGSYSITDEIPLIN